jgi:hypothetical protein
MRLRLAVTGLMVGAFAAALMVLPAQARDARAASSASKVSSASASGQGDSIKGVAARDKPAGANTELNADAASEHSDGVDEVLKMVKAGVSTEVIRTYIENSPVVYNLNAADIIALKEHGVPDELTTAMMRRGAALKAQVRQAMADNARFSAHPAPRRHYQLDPEGYDYFQYYYLYPRTLSAANQRFYGTGGFAPGFTPFGYGYGYGYGPGYYGPPPFWSLAPSAFGHP